ncbi:MAG TPA: hypothetical protein VG893_09975 [Terracidiphilus sp.]|nr:hypothetical protein [Terracidiphilus sp.]
MKTVPVRFALCLLAFVLCGVASSAQSLSLSNGTAHADFDRHGLVRIQENNSGAGLELARDAWSLTIDGAELRSADAEPRVAHDRPDAITYSYHLRDFDLDVTYRLKTGWSFVSKQIRIVRAPVEHFTVQQVVLWDVTVENPIESDYVPSVYTPQFGATIAQSRAHLPGKDYGAFLRMAGGAGALLTVQNPYLAVHRDAQSLHIAYDPQMEWNTAWGSFESDAACLSVYRLSGRRLPSEMVTEWHLPPAQMPDDGMDRAEIGAFTNCVRAFLDHPAPDPISVEVGWTLNDYQIDAGTEAGRAEYKRIIDAASQLGIQTLLYAPGNSQISARAQSADTWSWEYVLWLGLGEKIRKGQWDPAKDPLPSSVSEMLDYAKQKHIGLLAYVYPSIPYAGNSSWLVQRLHSRETVPETGKAPVYSTLASRAFQDYLIHDLIAFQKRTGIAGYSFDYTWLDLPGSSSYAQWYGWRRVMTALREADPAIVIDGRQSYQLYGPWSWLEGSYPHPTGTDEQPESFRPFPDLHFDRVSADRTRFVNYWYRNYQFAPTEVVPGYATHQTERSRNVPAHDGHPAHAETVYTRYRTRDWDYLGYKYSFLSSIATGGWNNIVDMIPARDPEEARHFSEQDKEWIRGWLQWTISHRDYLRNTHTILDQPALGHVDGTSAIIGDHGYLFLFNPNYKRMSAALTLDDSIGLHAGGAFLLRELYPQKGRLIGKPGAGLWSQGDMLSLDLDGTSATVLEIVPAPSVEQPLLFNAASMSASIQPEARLTGTVLALSSIAGEPGTAQPIGVLLPAARSVTRVAVNGVEQNFKQSANYIDVPVRFAGERFAQAQQVTLALQPDGALAGSFTVPPRIFAQLAERKKQWPIPWTAEDYATTWLAPERLLLYLQLAEPRDTLQITAELDGKSLPLTPAYTSTRVDAPCFVGFYADLSRIAPGVRHRIVLHAPGLAAGQLQGVFFENVAPQFTTQLAPHAESQGVQ